LNANANKTIYIIIYKEKSMLTALTYDDVSLIPAYSEIESRQTIDLSTQFTRNYRIQIPLIASPMDTVCESEMAISMMNMGGVGIIHRFMTIGVQAQQVMRVHLEARHLNKIGELPVAASIGANGDYLERAQELVKNGTDVILIDVAHGYHKFVKDALSQLKANLPSHVDIIAGNIATAEAAIALEEWGADALRVGIGGGSLCTTRVKTGFGVPNVSSIQDVSNVATVPVIACGGIRNSGDIAKALTFGADSVILGSLLAGTKEAPGAILETPTGLYKRYRGAASLETKITHNQVARNVEGESTTVPFKGGVKFIVDGLTDGIRSAFSYAGASNITEFNPSYVQVTAAGVAEGKPHLLR
jgi:IMP dehydrogenase